MINDDFADVYRAEMADRKVAHDRGISVYQAAAERQFFELFAFLPSLWCELGLLGKVTIFPLALALWVCVMLPVTLVFGVCGCYAAALLEGLTRGGWFWKGDASQ